MATKSSFKQQCPSCEAMVPIRDPKLIGRKIDCPKCKYRFVVEEPVEEEEEVDEEPAKKGKSAAVTNKKPAGGKAGSKAASKRRPDDDEDVDDAPAKKKKSGSSMLVIGIGLAVVAVVALAVGGIFLFTGDGTGNKSSGGSKANVVPPGGGTQGQQQNTQKNDGPKPEALKPRQEDVSNLLPNDTQIVLNLPLEFLFGNSKVKQALLHTPGAFHEGAFRNIWGIAPADVRRVLLSYNVEKKTLFSVMRTSQPIKEEEFVRRLKLKAESIGNLRYYLVARPLDALSTLLLKGVGHHNKVALHFVDPLTVVCADMGPMQQFLQDKGQPKNLTKQQVEEPKSGTQPNSQSTPPGPGQRPGAPGASTPPGGQPTPPPSGTGQPSGGTPSGYQAPRSNVPGGMQGSMYSGSGTSTSDAAPVSGSYLTIEPQLKAVMDQAEKVDRKDNQNVLVSLAVSTSTVSVDDVKNLLAQQGEAMPQVPDFLLKMGLETFQSQMKAAALAVTELNDSKVVINGAVSAKDEKLAKQWHKDAEPAMAALLLTSGLDLVSRKPSQGNYSSTPSGQTPSYMQPTPPGPQQGYNGMQPSTGNKPEEKGKQGDYLFWTQDNVLALGVNLNIKPSIYSAAGEALGYLGIIVRGIAAMADRSPRIHELATALQAYHEKMGHFPRGTVPMPPDSQHVFGWRPDQRLSWMTQVLPFLANGEFKDVRFDPTKVWYEDKSNERAGLTVIPQFVTPLESKDPLYFYVDYPNLPVKELGPGRWAATHFVGMAGVGLDAAEYRDGDAATAKLRGVFGYDRETKKDDIKDGAENTIALLQVPPEPKSPWIAGGGSTVRGISDDLDCVRPFVCAKYKNKDGKEEDGTFAIMADGKVRFIPASIDPKTFQAMCTLAGGEKIKDIEAVAPEVPPPEDVLVLPELKTEPPPPVAVNPPVKPEQPAARPQLPPGWQEITSQEGRFSIAMPAGMREEKIEKSRSISGGEIIAHRSGVTLPANAGAYVVVYSDYAPGNMTETMFYSEKMLLRSPTGKVIYDKKLALNGKPGREFQIDEPGKMSLTTRLILVNNRLYQLTVISHIGKNDVKAIQTFFDSFQLTGR